jgi:Uri superfamily endonuclease
MATYVDEAAWPDGPGSYVLIMHLDEPKELVVGKLGSFPLSPGCYAYVGSAHGPGGLRARLRRHLRARKCLHWHVDYLVCAVRIAEIYCLPDRQKRECQWVEHLLALPGATAPIRGFGSSDCRAGCPAHLVRLPDSYEPLRIKDPPFGSPLVIVTNRFPGICRNVAP